jgi:hypothetical protein
VVARFLLLEPLTRLSFSRSVSLCWCIGNIIYEGFQLENDVNVKMPCYNNRKNACSFVLKINKKNFFYFFFCRFC